MEQLIMETKVSYYGYVKKVEGGCQLIADLLHIGKEIDAFNEIYNLSEGFEWLLSIEELLLTNGYIINSRIKEANNSLEAVNNAMEMKDYAKVAELFEKLIKPIFDSSTEWVFEKTVV